MKLASYNVENLFLRAAALNQATWKAGKTALGAHAELNALFGKARYTRQDKKRILHLLTKLGLDEGDDAGPFAVLRQNRGHLLKRPKSGKMEVVADGRADWTGWVELKTEEVDETATRATARVIQDVDADVLAVVEAESRAALVRLSNALLPSADRPSYEHAMLIDGNDDRGIDVGIMTRRGFEIVSMQSHVDDHDKDGPIFSRDCATYTIRTVSGTAITVLVNHFKSKGFGSYRESNDKRRRQAQRVKKIYESLRASGQELVAVVGDFNDTPSSKALAPLLGQTDLRDISEHRHFDDGADGERPGTFGNGAASNKIDFILLSPELFKRTRRGGIFRLGVWGGKNGTLFPHYPEITRAEEAASDHAAIWAEVDA